MSTHNLSGSHIWYLAIRPKTLPASVAPIILGISFAYYNKVFQVIPALVTLAFAILLQILSNLANDYFDFIKGIDTAERMGPTRVLAGGLLTQTQLRNGIIKNIILIVLAWLYLVWVAGLPLLMIGFLCIVCAIIYSGGPIPLGSKALGDFLVFIFFGVFAVTATYYIQALDLTTPVIIASIPIGLLITGILIINNYRDIDTDSKAGKVTLAVIMGRQLTRIYLLVLIILSYIIAIFLIFLIKPTYWYLSLLLFLSVPISLKILHTVFTITEGPSLNKTLALTANLSLLFSLLLSLIIIF